MIRPLIVFQVTIMSTHSAVDRALGLMLMWSASALALESPSPSPTPTEPPKEEPPAHEELNSSYALLILIAMLLSTLLVSYYLQLKKIRVVHETVVAILLGFSCKAPSNGIPVSSLHSGRSHGGTGSAGHTRYMTALEAPVMEESTRLMGHVGSTIRDMVDFDHKFFFNLLLPPIILNSGYDLHMKNFFLNFGSILTFALLGTMISTVVIGVFVMMIVATGLHALPMTPLDCLIFGAILSSTDPVTVLSIFHQLRVDPKLYAIIFGESVLNDSVAIVLFSVLGGLRNQDVTLGNLFMGSFTFVGVFFGSMLVGLIVALITALLLKHSEMRQYPSLESCVVTLLAYFSYLISNVWQLSGIVSLLFCGIAMKHYAFDNMSLRSRRTTKYMFRVLSQMSENFIFIYLGLAVFTQHDAGYYPFLIIFTLLFIGMARWVSVVPLSQMLNFINVRVYKRGEIIPKNHQMMLWWAGLRGAVAFALSFEVTGDAAPPIRSTTLIVCIVSVLVLGGTTNYAINRYNIRIGVGSDSHHRRRRLLHLGHGQGVDDDDLEYTEDPLYGDTDSSDSDAGEPETSPHGLQDEHSPLTPNHSAFDAGGLRERNASSSQLRTSFDSLVSGWMSRPMDATHWFVSFDSSFIKPIFSRTRWRQEWKEQRSGGGHARTRFQPPHFSPARDADVIVMDSGRQRQRPAAESSKSSAREDQRKTTQESSPSGISLSRLVPVDDDETFKDIDGNTWTSRPGGSKS